MTTTRVVSAEVHHERRLTCPECGRFSWPMEHIFNDVGDRRQPVAFGPWYCERCHWGIIGRAIDELTVEVERHTDRCIPTRVTLEGPQPADGSAPLRIVVEGRLFVEGDRTPVIDDEQREQDRYFYEEHTCPKNFLHVLEVQQGDDRDPHGVFRYVSTELATDEVGTSG